MHPTDCGEVLGFAGSQFALCRALSSCFQGFVRAPRGRQGAAGTHVTSKQAVSVLEALLLVWLFSAGLIVLCKHLGSLGKPFTPRSHQHFRHTHTEWLTVNEWVGYIVKTTIRMGSKM